MTFCVSPESKPWEERIDKCSFFFLSLQVKQMCLNDCPSALSSVFSLHVMHQLWQVYFETLLGTLLFPPDNLLKPLLKLSWSLVLILNLVNKLIRLLLCLLKSLRFVTQHFHNILSRLISYELKIQITLLKPELSPIFPVFPKPFKAPESPLSPRAVCHRAQ